jgi:hypothetical protein
MRYLIGTLLSFLLISCDPNVLFREPQPAGSRDLAKFPARVHGTYLETMDDSSVYVVTSTYIFQKYVEKLNLPVEEILEDEEVALKGDTLILADIVLAFPVIRRNDSVFGTITVYDTIFDLSAEDKLRKLRKDYFLNFPHDSMWMVLKLQFGKDQKAYLFDINEDKEAKIFEQYCAVEVIRNDKDRPGKYIMNPGRNELKALLKLETFTDSTEFIRISK